LFFWYCRHVHQIGINQHLARYHHDRPWILKTSIIFKKNVCSNS
jgi:hypothetical protein